MILKTLLTSSRTSNMNKQKISYYFLSNKIIIIIITITGIIYNIGLLAGPLLEGYMVQNIYDIYFNNAKNQMILLVSLYIIAILFVQFMRYLKRSYVRRFANNINKDMKTTVFDHLLQSQNKENIGSTLTKVINDCEQCSEGIRKFTTEVFDTGIAMISYLFMLLYYDYKLALISMLFLAFAYYLASSLKKIVTAYTRNHKRQEDILNNKILERLVNAASYRMYGIERYQDEIVDDSLKTYKATAIKANMLENIMPPIYHLISMIASIIIIYYGAKNVNNEIWNIAIFTTYFAYYQKLAVKASKSAKLFNSVQKAKVSWYRIKPYLISHATSQEDNLNIHQLTLKDISYGYPDQNYIINNLNLSCYQNEIIGICGPIASGKTTLAKLIIQDLPYEGEMFADGKKLTYEYCSYMGHHHELFNDTIKNNITFNHDRPIDKYLKLSCLDNDNLDISCHIGTNGIKLSGGQQARIIIARMLYHQKPIMIFDDPFSSVDHNTEMQIFNNIRNNIKGSIIFIISHRMSTFKDMDKIIFIDKDKILIDTHDNLLNNQDYYDLYHKMEVEHD